MKILVTGASGFIGSHLVETLVARGEKVKALVRKTSNIRHLENLRVELIVGDLKKPESVDLATKGSDIVFHIASTPDWALKKEVERTNYNGTVNMLEAALRWNIKRFIYCSSTSVLGFTDRSPLDEASPHSPSPYSHYAQIKCKAEKEALTFHRNGLPVTILRPAQVYGPRSIGTMGMAFTFIKRGFFPLMGGGAALLQPIYIQDLVDAMIKAMEADEAPGQVYNIAGDEILSFKQWFTIIEKAFEVNALKITLPKKVAWGIGYCLEMKTRIFGGRALFTRFRVECATRNMTYSISKAAAELGFYPKVGIEEGVKRTVDWYRHR